jgi:outer membrane protein OmpA-like peptidoglycan-associated protein
MVRDLLKLALPGIGVLLGSTAGAEALPLNAIPPFHYHEQSQRPETPQLHAQGSITVLLGADGRTAASILTTELPAGASTSAGGVDAGYAFSASLSTQGVLILSGQVPKAQDLEVLAAIGDSNFDAVSLAAGAPTDFVANAEAGLRALAKLSEGQLDFADGKWALRGTADNDLVRADALSAILALPSAPDWLLEVSLAAAPAQAAPVATRNAKCSIPLAEFSARNAILFQSGAARIAPESQAALDELAADLHACPEALVHVEGHTDTDGDDQLNLALSVARAEAVVRALVDRGIVAARLYAVGYGESSPIATNDTPDGKRLNRRIVVTMVEGQ